MSLLEDIRQALVTVPRPAGWSVHADSITIVVKDNDGEILDSYPAIRIHATAPNGRSITSTHGDLPNYTDPAAFAAGIAESLIQQLISHQNHNAVMSMLRNC